MAKRSRAIKRVVWAVDPLAEKLTFQKHTLKTVLSFTEGMACKIEPVFVVTPPNPYLPERGLRDFFENISSAVKNVWGKLVPANSATSRKVMAPKMLAEKSFSTNKAVTHLTQYGVKSGADLIVVSTHGRKGLSRTLLGSFAETLILQNPIPTLVVNPHTNFKKKLTHVLFPADLTDASFDTFESALQLAKSLKARITIFHKVEFVNEYSAPVLKNMPAYHAMMDEDLKHRKELLEKYSAAAAKAGVRSSVVIDSSKKYPGDAILAAMKKLKPCVIAMTSKTGRLTSALMGSTTRQIIRGADCPVWVVHPEANPPKTLSSLKNAAISAAYMSGLR